MIRLVKMIIQPVLVYDDGENLKELQVQPVTVGAEDWPEFPTKGWIDALAQLEAQLEQSGSVEMRDI